MPSPDLVRIYIKPVLVLPSRDSAYPTESLTFVKLVQAVTVHRKCLDRLIRGNKNVNKLASPAEGQNYRPIRSYLDYRHYCSPELSMGRGASYGLIAT